jgi:hypothetical protein
MSGRDTSPRSRRKRPIAITLDNIRRGEMKRLLLHRGVSNLEVYNEVENILAERIKWTAHALGQRVKLKFEEKIKLSIRTLRCIDRTAKMVRLYFRMKKRERDRVRWQQRKQVSRSELSPVAKWLADRLSSGVWVRAADLVEQLREYRGRRRREAARSALRRAVRELHDAGRLDTQTVDAPKGGFETFVRLKEPEKPAFLHLSISKKPLDIEVLGEASSFRPPVKQPPVKYSSPQRRSLGKPGQNQTRSDTKIATRPIDSYYAASTAKPAPPKRGGRANWRVMSVL